MKKTRKLLALLLCAALCVSIFPAAAFAEDAQPAPYKLVAIGDSTLNGYTLDDYGKFSDASWARLGSGYLRHWGGFLDYSSKSAAPYLMKEYLEETLGREVEFTSLALEGQRTDEVRKLLDPSFEADDFDPWHIARYNEVFDKSKAHLGITDPDYKINDFYRDNIEAADLIIFDCCTNNYGTFLSGKLQDALGGGMANVYTPADVVGRLSPEVKAAAEKISDMVKETVGSVLPEGVVSDLANTFAYAFCDMCANYTWDIEKFYELNPDVKIIAVAPFSIMDGLVASYGGIDIDLGNVWATMIGLANTYITTLDPNCGNVLYAELPNGVECFATAFARGELTWYFRQIVIEEMGSSLGYSEDEINDYVAANDFLAKYDKLSEAEQNSQANLEQKAACEALLKDWDSTFQLFIDCSGVSTLDFDLAFGIIQSKGLYDGTKAIVRDALKNELTFDQLDNGQKTMLHVYARFIVDGIGTHPSKVGAQQKFEAIKKAYDNNITAAQCAGNTAANTGIHAAVGILNTITAPIANAINKIFSFIDFGNFFKMIMDGVSEFLLKLIR